MLSRNYEFYLVKTSYLPHGLQRNVNKTYVNQRDQINRN